MSNPTGKNQKAIMEVVNNAEGAVELNDMVRRSEFRGVDYADIMSAAAALKKKGLIKYDGQKLKKASSPVIEFENALLADAVATRFASSGKKTYKALSDLDKELERASGAAVAPAVAKAKKLLSGFKSQVEARISELEKDRDTDPSYGAMIERSNKLLKAVGKADSVPELQKALGDAKKWMENNGLHK